MARPFNRAELPPAPDLHFERLHWQGGDNCVAGVDEAGRGAWAGPVSAGAVILPPDARIQQQLCDVRDSKQMLPAARAFWAERIRACVQAWGVGFASSQEIDRLGIIAATRLAMSRALAVMPVRPDALLIDALLLPGLSLPQAALIKGDARSLSIAAASILAKTARDALMAQYEDQYPGYGFARHKGYGTALHWAALAQNGPTAIHRTSFAPVARCIR